MEELKHRITDYWTQRVSAFSQLRLKELEGDMHLRWLAEFDRYLPKDRKLKILDVGTGTGFFAFLLAAQGHEAIGIDLTEDMVLEARRVSEKLNIPASFFVMDGEKPDFPKESFDVIVTRNLTWNLPHLPLAYESWYDLLKPEGLLLNFDADYCREKQAELPENHAHRNIGRDLMTEYESLKELLRQGQYPRPQWDELLLTQRGFRDITVDTGVWQRIYREKDEFYNPTPIFCIAAYK